MSVKEQRISRDENSEKLAKIGEMINLAETIHEEYGEIATTDLERLYTKTGVEGTIKGEGKFEYFRLYDYFAENYSKFIISTMKAYAQKTESSEIEYINILLDDGSYLILEGEEDKVVIPHPSALASTHTHPGVCLFSHTDLETADYLFIRNYLAIGVITTDCLLLLYRRGVYTLEDRDSLLSLARKLRKSKSGEEIIKAYNESAFNQLSFRLFQYS